MYTPTALLDMHERSQKSLRGLIAHCGSLTSEELDRHLLDFGLPPHGEPSVRLQLTHTIGAQRYWLGCLQGRIEAEDPVLASMAEIEAFRESVSALVAGYLRSADEAELNTPRASRKWGQAPELHGARPHFLRPDPMRNGARPLNVQFAVTYAPDTFHLPWFACAAA